MQALGAFPFIHSKNHNNKRAKTSLEIFTGRTDFVVPRPPGSRSRFTGSGTSPAHLISLPPCSSDYADETSYLLPCSASSGCSAWRWGYAASSATHLLLTMSTTPPKFQHKTSLLVSGEITAGLAERAALCIPGNAGASPAPFGASPNGRTRSLKGLV